MDEATAKYIMYELLKGVGYIHSRRICHRDIKLENILLDNLGRIKLADFGISKLCKCEEDEDDGFPADMPMKEACGTPVYMAPEVINARQNSLNHFYTSKCDMWSIGVISYALLCGKLPFDINYTIKEKDRNNDLIERISNFDEKTDPCFQERCFTEL